MPRHWIEKGLSSYEKILIKRGCGNYSIQNQVSLADLCLIPQCYNAIRFQVDLEKYVNINKIYKFCIKNDPHCIATKPENYALPKVDLPKNKS